MPQPSHAPFVLIIRDGWGTNPNPEHDAFNAIKLADTPVADALAQNWPMTLIRTSGLDVGLPDGKMGNSEVGHQNIGAGRIVDQEVVRISKACDAGLENNPVLCDAVDHARDADRTIHLMGICSDAGVHGLLEHLYAIIRLCKHQAAPRVAIHLFTDGRDTSPFTGKNFIQQVQDFCDETNLGKIVSVIGRYWAMDRDNRWERIARAYRCLTGNGEPSDEPRFCMSATDAVQQFYDQPTDPNMVGDEFIEPTMIGTDQQDARDWRIVDGDTVIFYNYRGDRPREIVSAFLLDQFADGPSIQPSPDTGAVGFNRGQKLKLHFVIMCPYSQVLAQLAQVAFPRPPALQNIAGKFWSNLGLTQFRCAETEKYPHVTFFFNDYRDEPFEGECRQIIQSPMVSTYDQQPEMSAAGVCQAVLDRLSAGDDCEQVIVVNFANADMVGHTGKLDAAILACQTVDAAVGKIIDAVLARNGCAIVTADHGNAEQMLNPETNMPHTSHTTFDVPLFVIGEAFKNAKLCQDGRLADIVPTSIQMMNLTQPDAMTGRSLLV